MQKKSKAIRRSLSSSPLFFFCLFIRNNTNVIIIFFFLFSLISSSTPLQTLKTSPPFFLPSLQSCAGFALSQVAPRLLFHPFLAMEAKKIEETRNLVRQASALLRDHLQHSPQTPLTHRERQRLREVLQLLLPSLFIVRSFEQQPQHHHYRCVYATIENAVQEVLACPALRVTDAQSEKERAEGTRSDDGEAQSRTPADGAQTPLTPTIPSDSAAAIVDPVLCWSDMYGCEEAILVLRQATTLPMRFPALFTGPRRPWRRLLLYGPPGTGKTQLAAATAAEFHAVFLSVSAADLLSKWVGESEKQVRQAFAQAAAAGPRCVLFFDEIDALCSARGSHGESELARRLKTEFLLHLQRVAVTVLVLAATNLPWELDTAIVRRFDRFVPVGLPSLEVKARFVRDALRGVTHTITEDQLRNLMERTEGFSLVDVRRLLSYAVMAPVTEWLLSRHPDLEAEETQNGTTLLERYQTSFHVGEEAGALPACAEGPPSQQLKHPSYCTERMAEGNVKSEDETFGDVSSGWAESAPNDRSEPSRGTLCLADSPLEDNSPMTPAASSLLPCACTSGVPPVEAKHFEEALRSVAATTPAADAARYVSWSSHVA